MGGSRCRTVEIPPCTGCSKPAITSPAQIRTPSRPRRPPAMIFLLRDGFSRRRKRARKEISDGESRGTETEDVQRPFPSETSQNVKPRDSRISGDPIFGGIPNTKFLIRRNSNGRIAWSFRSAGRGARWLREEKQDTTRRKTRETRPTGNPDD